MDINEKKPRLIILEGPAGVGKTSVQKYLSEAFSLKNINVGTLSEFSENELGKFIKKNSRYEFENPYWLKGINGIMFFLADKINMLDVAHLEGNKIWICDRFISTQFILGVRTVNNVEDKLFANEIIQRTFDWSMKMISDNSIIIFLDSNIDILKRRLKNRIDRELSQQEISDLEYEITEYRRLAVSLNYKNTIKVNADQSINDIGDEILDLSFTLWQH